MRILSLAVILLIAFAQQVKAEDDPGSVFFADIERAQIKYRASIAETLRKADRVMIYLVDFDGVKDADEFEEHDKSIRIEPYNARTTILQSKEVTGEARKKLLNALIAQISNPKQDGGSFCHYPIHGIKIYRGEELLYESTFCWACGNFSFKYPEGSQWLATNDELKLLFAAAMPIPQKELDRFHRKYPMEAPKSPTKEEAKPKTENLKPKTPHDLR